MRRPLLLRYHGHACVSLVLDGQRWVLDPFASPLFDGRFTYPLPRGPFDVAACSHPHADHAHVGPHLGQPRVANQDAQLGRVRLRFVPTAHDPHGGVYLGESRMIVLEAPEGRIVHAGDLGEIPGAALRAAIGRPDLLLVPVGGTYTLDAAEAGELLRVWAPRVVVPIHYRTRWCTLPLASPLDFLRAHPHRYVPTGELTLDGAEAPGAGGPRVYWLEVFGAETPREANMSRTPSSSDTRGS